MEKAITELLGEKKTYENSKKNYRSIEIKLIKKQNNKKQEIKNKKKDFIYLSNKTNKKKRKKSELL